MAYEILKNLKSRVLVISGLLSVAAPAVLHAAPPRDLSVFEGEDEAAAPLPTKPRPPRGFSRLKEDHITAGDPVPGAALSRSVATEVKTIKFGVACRSRPGRQGKVQVTLKKNAQVTQLSPPTAWVQVTTSNQARCWIPASAIN